MITTYYLCAVLMNTLQCLPFATEEACITANGALAPQLVQRSECAKVTMRLYASQDWAPIPPRNPNREIR